MNEDLRSYLDRLGAAEGFTVEQLEANRAGRVHGAQLARGRRGLVSAIFMFVFGDLALAGGLIGAYLFHADLRPPISSVDMNAVYGIAGAGVLVSLALFLGAVLTLRARTRRSKAYQAGTVEVVEGPLSKTLLQGKRGSGDLRSIQVRGRAFFVSRASFELLTHGATYRLYCVGGDLLSLEPVSPARP